MEPSPDHQSSLPGLYPNYYVDYSSYYNQMSASGYCHVTQKTLPMQPIAVPVPVPTNFDSETVKNFTQHPPPGCSPLLPPAVSIPSLFNAASLPQYANQGVQYSHPNQYNRDFGNEMKRKMPVYGNRRGNMRNTSSFNTNNPKFRNADKVKQNTSKNPKTDILDKKEYYCESCDRGYKLEETYNQHCATHIKCKVDGCPYVAAAKLVEIHYNAQHKTGLAKKIWSLESKEDIEKWIQERKKNYPTAANVASKKKAQEEKLVRGDVLETKEFGRMRDRNERGRGRRHLRMKRVHNDQPSNPEADDRDRKSLIEDVELFIAKKKAKLESELKNQGKKDTHKPLPSTNGVRYQNQQVKASPNKHLPEKVADLDPLSFVLGDNDSDEKEETEVEKPLPKILKTSGGLGSLITAYGSDTSSEDEEGEIKDEPVESEQKPVIVESQEAILPHTDAQVGSKESISETVLHKGSKEIEEERDDTVIENGSTEKKCKSRNKSNPRKKNGCRQNGHFDFVKRHRSTLLEKLLAADIRKERNTLLQCIRHITNKKFYGLDSSDVNSNLVNENLLKNKTE